MKYRLLILVYLCTAAGAAAANNTPEAVSVSANSSDNYDTRSQLASIKQLIDSGDFRDAVSKLKLLSKTHQEDPEIWRLLGVASLGKGDFLGSKVAFEKSLKLDPENSQTLSLQTELFVSIGDKKSAQSNRDKLAVICPNGCDLKK